MGKEIPTLKDIDSVLKKIEEASVPENRGAYLVDEKGIFFVNKSSKKELKNRAKEVLGIK